MPALPPFARGPVLGAMAAVALALTLASPAYGYHRDELYFRMLPPQWGYVDQPPLTPLIARATLLLADETWALHVPATLLMALSVAVVALVTRELGGDRAAQALCAWAYATSLLPLEFARVLLTATVDLVVWPLVVLLVLRAVRRDDPRWWLAVGLVVGLSTYNKWLVSLLVVSLAAGIALLGPRRLLGSPWVWGAGLLALALAAPNLAYQATHGWPQLDMGRALARHNATEVRLLALPILLVMLGLPLVPVWVAGLVGLWRGRDGRGGDWGEVRFLAAALPVLLVLVVSGGSQFYYSLGLLTVMLAAGCVVVVHWWREGPRSRARWVVAGVAANAVTSALIALPLVPLEHLGSTPVPLFNQIAQDQVGWEQYVADVARVVDALPAEDRARAVVVTDNYGEAGAIDRYGAAYGIEEVYSAQNELYLQGRPPEEATVAVVVGTRVGPLRRVFADCRVGGRLDHGLGVDNQEQGRPVSVCDLPAGGWAEVWPRLRHYD